ncbi:2683_t:CDS:1 [Ambispora leptoticha]|uniref:D-arabinono-1,4-lactone oxidase n=1 Tax=Ambispora leptoticha TaxID=144679 RepID=A0A9N9HQV3_9GLOM|nr:2683_t:CDS:1 [Ambispora leptoticha]
MKILKPKSENEIQDIIKDAVNAATPTIVRVIGSNHSWSRAIFDAKDIPKTTNVKFISLTNLRGVEKFEPTSEQTATVTVWAGTNIGKDPRDKDSTLENSLTYQLDQHGYSLPDTGGISHQTVGGFLSTGSAGGSLVHSIDEAVIGIRLIDGTGTIHDLTEKDNDKFLAAGVSMGLLGIITKVTFKLQKKFYITGIQTISPIKPLSRDINVGCPIDFFGIGDKDQGIPSISEFFSNNRDYDTDYSRILWWPQDGLDRVSIWKAKKISDNNGPIDHFKQPSIFIQFFGKVILAFLNVIEFPGKIYNKIAAFLLKNFSEIGVEYFQDRWWNGLPMDNDICDQILPVAFTELWISFDKTKDVMNKLQELFTNEPKSVGNFITEIYTAKKSRFWLSPAYERDVIRIDPFYFLGNLRGTPEDHFRFYWNALKEYNFRCHWGKYTPDEYGNEVPGLFSKYENWMAIRQEMDPHQIFVTPYWRSRLTIPNIN